MIVDSRSDSQNDNNKWLWLIQPDIHKVKHPFFIHPFDRVCTQHTSALYRDSNNVGVRVSVQGRLILHQTPLDTDAKHTQGIGAESKQKSPF